MLFFRIEDIRWEDKDIVVMGQVRIKAPYRPVDCIAANQRAHSQQKDYVQKLVRNLADFFSFIPLLCINYVSHAYMS